MPAFGGMVAAGVGAVVVVLVGAAVGVVALAGGGVAAAAGLGEIRGLNKSVNFGLAGLAVGGGVTEAVAVAFLRARFS